MNHYEAVAVAVDVVSSDISSQGIYASPGEQQYLIVSQSVHILPQQALRQVSFPSLGRPSTPSPGSRGHHR